LPEFGRRGSGPAEKRAKTYIPRTRKAKRHFQHTTGHFQWLRGQKQRRRNVTYSNCVVGRHSVLRLKGKQKLYFVHYGITPIVELDLFDVLFPDDPLWTGDTFKE
jgi:hypothetical protein